MLVVEPAKKPGVLSEPSLHLVALPHTRIEPEFCGCAYTSKILKFCKMLGNQYEIFVYAPEGKEIPGARLIPCLSNQERIEIFGEDDPIKLPAWPTDEQSYKFNHKAINALREWTEPRDLILLTAGWTHKVIGDAFPNHIKCEPGVGYQGILTNYCAFESYAWMHHVYALKGIYDGRWFDCVIPNYFDIDDFFQYQLKTKPDYLLFLGRVIARKGPHIAGEIAQALGLPLLIAGAGAKQEGKDVVAQEIIIKNATYVGPVDVYQRAKLLTEAIALICPTTYIEPFGGVAVEAMMCGTPVIGPDWGAFTETIKEGLSGFRFRTLAQAKEAVQKCQSIDRKMIQEYAVTKYSLSAIAPMFHKWFNQLNSLWDKGWYS